MIKVKGSALITGSAKRIGREIVLNLAERGFETVIHCNKSIDEAKELASEVTQKFSLRSEIFCCDLNDPERTKEMAQFMKNNFSNWNLLINNASIFNQSKFLSSSDLEVLHNLNVHLVSPMILSKEFAQNAIEKKIKNAQIINMLDKNIERYDTCRFHYLITKKFLAEFTRMVALELAPLVRVNGIAPGFLSNVDQSKDDKKIANLVKKIPLQRKCEVKNILQALDFLLLNEFVTGQIIFVDGGASLNHAG